MQKLIIIMDTDVQGQTIGNALRQVSLATATFMRKMMNDSWVEKFYNEGLDNGQVTDGVYFRKEFENWLGKSHNLDSNIEIRQADTSSNLALSEFLENNKIMHFRYEDWEMPYSNFYGIEGKVITEACSVIFLDELNHRDDVISEIEQKSSPHI